MYSSLIIMSIRASHVGFAFETVKLLALLVFLVASVRAGSNQEGSLHHLDHQGFTAPSFDSGTDGSRISTCLLLYRSRETSGEEDFFLLRMESSILGADGILPNSSRLDFTEKSSPADVLVAFGGGLLATFALLCPCLRRQRKSESKDFPSKGTSASISISRGESSFGCSTSTANSTSSEQPLQRRLGGKTFTFAELSKATKKFSPSCKIGQGSFGIVYKGNLEDGTLVAIKRAKKKVYDARLSTEFDNELEMLLSIDHLNLVKIIGYLDESDERILVVEYVPNGNLREHLDGLHGAPLDLATRLEICIDVAHALTYLHMYAGKPIIHRDVKTSNILLTEKFRAKVADFGYSRMGPIEIGETHVSTEVKGTTGYLDPEYLKSFQLTEKSDVYSFGVVLVEVITGRRPIDEKKDMKERVAIRWAFKKFLNGNVMEVLDPRLESSNAAGRVAEKICELAFQCTAPTKQDRPTMKEVAQALWNIRKEFQEGKMNRCESEKHAGKLTQGMTAPSFNVKEMERAKSSIC